MASVIKAGNATDGVQVTSDNTGILELKTGTGSGTTAITVDTSQNVGIGTTSPGSFVGSVKMVVGSAATTTTSCGISVYSGTATYGGLYFADGIVGDQLYRGAVEYNHSQDALLMYSAGAERARITSGGDIQLTNGNLVIGTSGKGIDFSATPGTGTSELLSDYEEGTFEPIALGSTTAGTGTYTLQAGRYTKIGRVCLFQLTIGWSAHTGTGGLYLGGLPFTALGADGEAVAGQSVATLGYNNGLLFTNQPVLYVAQGNTQLHFTQTTTGGVVSGIPMDTLVTELIVNGHYIVA